MEKQEQNSICREIGARTGGDIYIGVVGPVRSGKSTFIKQFREQLVLPAPVSRVCLAGNTAMTALARGASVLGLASAPYALEFHGNSEESLPGLPPVYFPPQVSTYIGADISAGMAFDSPFQVA